MNGATTLTEADILAKAIAFQEGELTPEVARAFLDFKFDRRTTRQIRQLLQKNNRGTISAKERIALEKFLRVGQFLDLLHAKARVRLRGNGASH